MDETFALCREKEKEEDAIGAFWTSFLK